MFYFRDNKYSKKLTAAYHIGEYVDLVDLAELVVSFLKYILKNNDDNIPQYDNNINLKLKK